MSHSLGWWRGATFVLTLSSRAQISGGVMEFMPAAAAPSRELPVREGYSLAMGLANVFDEIVGSLPDDWTDLELELRLADERRYVDAAVLLVTCNAQPNSKSEWHWRILVAHRFGHAAAAPAVHAALRLLDEAGIEAELALREVRTGRAEVIQMWGRTESVRRDFKRLRAQ